MSPVRRKELGWEVGESSLRIEQVVLQRERAAFAAALCDGDGVLDAPQPPSLLVLLALRYSGRVAATVAGGAGGGVAEDLEPRASHTLPGPGAAARLAPRRSGSAGSKFARAASQTPVSPSTLSCRARPRAKALGLPRGS